MKKNKILVLTNGERVPVTGEDGKWWLAEGRRFRKLSFQIASVEEEEIKEAERESTLVEAISEVKNEVAEPKKKTATRKKKTETKAEESF